MPIFIVRKCCKFRPLRTAFKAIWQTAVLTAKQCIFWAQQWSFSAFSHYVFNECHPNIVFYSVFVPNTGLMVKFGAKLAFLQVNGVFGNRKGYWGFFQKGSLSAFSQPEGFE